MRKQVDLKSSSFEMSVSHSPKGKHTYTQTKRIITSYSVGSHESQDETTLLARERLTMIAHAIASRVSKMRVILKKHEVESSSNAWAATTHAKYIVPETEPQFSFQKNEYGPSLPSLRRTIVSDAFICARLMDLTAYDA